ncbi:MAG: EcsC family protein [Desulfamplus sp.]|nr:EcsC family protein [Desulfamplus sp.]
MSENNSQSQQESSSEKVDESTILKAVDWAYDKAVNGGIPGFDTAQELAESYMKGDGNIYDKVNSLIKWQDTKAATSGFVTNCGGVISTLTIGIPTNITSVIYVQMRMIGAIAYMGGYDLNDDQVKTMVYTSLVGNEAKDIIKEAGIQIGTKLTKNMVTKISGKSLTKINQKVGFRLITRFGQKGVINLGKLIPVAGGVIGATLDALSTHTIGKVAKKLFISADSTGYITNGLLSVFETLKDISKEIGSNKLSDVQSGTEIKELILNTSIIAAQNSVQNSGLSKNKPEIINEIQAKYENIDSFSSFAIGSDYNDKALFNKLDEIINNIVAASQGRYSDMSLINMLDNFLAAKQSISSLVKSSMELGRSIGQASNIKDGELIGSRFGGLMGIIVNYINQNFGIAKYQDKAIMEAEFSNKNLQLLQEFGVRQAQIEMLKGRMWDEIRRLDIEFKNKMVENEIVKKDMWNNINDLLNS